MKTNKYKILVLSDLKDTSNTILKTTANLAKAIGGDIDLLHVKKPVDIVESDNQLSSMRTINRDYLTSKDKIESIIKSIDKELSINYNLIYGNVKQEIKEYIENYNPDVIVLGKRKFNALKLAGDRITKFVLKKYSGIVLIASNENVLVPNKDLSLGVFNNFEHSSNQDFTRNLIEFTQKPIKSFKIKKSVNKDLEKNKGEGILKNTVEYIFESSDNAINNLSNYLLKSNVDLLCVNRGIEGFSKNQLTANNINSLIKNVDTSLLITK